MSSCVLAAPAKLNLHLGIHAELDERRYHRAESLMVALDLADEVCVEVVDGLEVPEVTCEPAVDVPAERNTAYRAAMELSSRVGRTPSVRIHIRKHVPDQAGMGGSSSDAAAVMRALCESWDIDVRYPLVAEAARAVGADVPFFLDPVPTLLTGAGDVVDRKFPPLAHPISVVLVRPAGPGVSTQLAYAAFDEEHEEPTDPGALCEALSTGDATGAALAPLVANNLDSVACRLLPAVGQARAWLLARAEVLGGQVTGSGSCVFGFCANDDDAQRVAEAARERLGAWACAAHIV